MGRKRRRGEGDKTRIFCFYCDRDFVDQHVVANHQKDKHFRCSLCHKPLTSVSGLMNHTATVHKETISKYVEGGSVSSLSFSLFDSLSLSLSLSRSLLPRAFPPPRWSLLLCAVSSLGSSNLGVLLNSADFANQCRGNQNRRTNASYNVISSWDSSSFARRPVVSSLGFPMRWRAETHSTMMCLAWKAFQTGTGNR